MRAIRAAEQRLFEEQTTKSYVGLQGDKEFCALMGDMVMGDAVSSDRLRVCQAPGGSGALSILAVMITPASSGRLKIGSMMEMVFQANRCSLKGQSSMVP